MVVVTVGKSSATAAPEGGRDGAPPLAAADFESSHMIVGQPDAAFLSGPPALGIRPEGYTFLVNTHRTHRKALPNSIVLLSSSTLTSRVSTRNQ